MLWLLVKLAWWIGWAVLAWLVLLAVLALAVIIGGHMAPGG